MAISLPPCVIFRIRIRRDSHRPPSVRRQKQRCCLASRPIAPATLCRRIRVFRSGRMGRDSSGGGPALVSPDVEKGEELCLAERVVLVAVGLREESLGEVLQLRFSQHAAAQHMLYMLDPRQKLRFDGEESFLKLGRREETCSSVRQISTTECRSVAAFQVVVPLSN